MAAGVKEAQSVVGEGGLVHVDAFVGAGSARRAGALRERLGVVGHELREQAREADGLGGDFTLAEDALQDAYVSALTAWERGIPDVPAAWLTTAARRRRSIACAARASTASA